MCSSSLVVLVFSSFSSFQQNCKHSFIIPSRILETEPMSKKDCEINAAKYLENSQRPSTFTSNSAQQSQEMNSNYIGILFLLKLRIQYDENLKCASSISLDNKQFISKHNKILDTLLTYLAENFSLCLLLLHERLRQWLCNSLHISKSSSKQTAYIEIECPRDNRVNNKSTI